MHCFYCRRVCIPYIWTNLIVYIFLFQSFSTTFLLTLFSQVMVDVKFPFPVYRKNEGFQILTFELFKLFPVGDNGHCYYLK